MSNHLQLFSCILQDLLSVVQLYDVHLIHFDDADFYKPNLHHQNFFFKFCLIMNFNLFKTIKFLTFETSYPYPLKHLNIFCSSVFFPSSSILFSFNLLCSGNNHSVYIYKPFYTKVKTSVLLSISF